MSESMNEEHADMHRVYGRAGGNGRLALRIRTTSPRSSATQV